MSIALGKVMYVLYSFFLSFSHTYTHTHNIIFIIITHTHTQDPFTIVLEIKRFEIVTLKLHMMTKEQREDLVKLQQSNKV